MTDTLTDAPAGTDPTPGYPIDKSMRCPFSPPADLRRLQADAPLQKVRLWDDSTAWLVTRYNELRCLRPAADLADLPFTHDSDVYGVHELPVTW